MRLLLVLLTVLGIAGMHTLGHPNAGGHGGASAMSTAHTPADGPASAGITVRPADGAAGWLATAPMLDPSALCVAILAAVGFVVALAAALAAAGHRSAPGRPPASLWLIRHAPPGPAPLGLRIADLSVLRT